MYGSGSVPGSDVYGRAAAICIGGQPTQQQSPALPTPRTCTHQRLAWDPYLAAVRCPASLPPSLAAAALCLAVLLYSPPALSMAGPAQCSRSGVALLDGAAAVLWMVRQEHRSALTNRRCSSMRILISFSQDPQSEI